ncbi:MAG: beta-L-arabinofuranosidase domain-containing protein [Pirellula sp.]
MLRSYGLVVPTIIAIVLLCKEFSMAQDAWQDPPIGAVGLLESSPIAEGLQVNRKVLDAIGVDRALLAFRVQAGLPTRNAKPLGGWAGPEPYGPFPGFFESHFLSAISMQSVHDSELEPWVHQMVAGLAECQRAMGGKYLFASPEDEFKPDRLDGVVWYRMHKLLEGLIAAHRFANSEEALQVAIALAEWIELRVEQYGEDFAKVKKIEYGGMTEAFANLYSITRRESFRQLALRWEEPERILKAFADGQDFNEHANTLLAKMVGAARLAELTDSELHRKACVHFWENVCGAGGKTYATGGTSVHEGMPGMQRLSNTTLRMPQETCVSYNLMKVTRSLYRITGEPKYVDYYERSLWNAILGSQDPKSGYKTYYQPLGSNSIKDFRSNEVGCYCCNGTGLENPSRSAEMIYSTRGQQLRVQLFVPSELTLKDWGIKLVQETDFPDQAKGRILLECQQPRRLTISVRVPIWTDQRARLKVNGQAVDGNLVPGEFYSIDREWKSEDRIEYDYPYTFRWYPMPDDQGQAALMLGPLALVGRGANETRGVLELPFGREDTQSLQGWLKPMDKRLEFQTTDTSGRKIEFVPYFKVAADTFFTGYWNLANKSDPQRSKSRNLALGKPTECSTPEPAGSNLEAFMRSAKAVDGNYGGPDDWYVKWFPNGLSPQWIIVDLENVESISKVQWVAAREDLDAKIAYRYRMESSLDKSNWESIADASENRDFHEVYEHSLPPQRARYIRLTTLPHPDLKDHQARPKIAEIMVFGAE